MKYQSIINILNTAVKIFIYKRNYCES